MASKASTQHINLKLSEIPIQLTILTVKHQRKFPGTTSGKGRAPFLKVSNCNSKLFNHREGSTRRI
ncbi:hypothetical protein CUMW_078090 [Citrus unshiu]|nr:hypothetical protein CUMW_078090 [Citrus unshiu]